MPPKAKPAPSTSSKNQSENKPNTGKARQASRQEKKEEPASSANDAPRRSARNAGKTSTNVDEQPKSKAKSEEKSAKTGQKRSRSKSEAEEKPKAKSKKETKAEEDDNKDADEAQTDKPGEGEEEQPKAKKSKTGKDDKDKKQKSATIGSKHDKADAPAAQGSNTRVPKKGQKAHWKAMPGWVEGTVVEVLTASKSVDGKQVKASKDEPRIVLKSSAKSGKICVHKPDNVYFDDWAHNIYPMFDCLAV